MKTLKNQFVNITFHEKTEYEKPYILGVDLTDRHNDPTFYTKKIRGIDKAWEFLTIIFNKEELKDDLKFYDIIKILDEKFNLSIRSYCAVD